MGIEEEEEHDDKDWEYEEEPALIFVGDKTPEVEAKVDDPDNGNGDEPDDIIIVALKNDKNTDNVFEQPELNLKLIKHLKLTRTPLMNLPLMNPPMISPLMMNPPTALPLMEKILYLYLTFIYRR